FDREQDLNGFVDFVDSNTEFIKIESNNLSKAIKLFQTINTRGKDLTVSDLTKSYLLSCLPDEEERDAFVEVWEQISSLVEGDYKQLDGILQSYRLYLQTDKADEEAYVELKSEFEEGERGPLEIVREIRSFTREFIDIESSEGKYLRILRNLRHKRYWKTILVAARMEDRGNKFEKGLTRELVSFYYSYWIAGYTSQKIKKPSYNILRKVKSGEEFDELTEYLGSKREDDNIPEEVSESLNQNNVYKETWHSDLLMALEYISYTDRKVPEIMFNSDTHVEHVLPRQYEKAMEKYPYWREKFTREEAEKLHNSLGNLTLLQYDLNGSAAQKNFPKKKEIYAGNTTKHEKTSFELSRRLLDYSDWSPQKIKENKNHLLDKISDLLNIPRDQLEETEDEEDEVEDEIDFPDAEKGSLVWEKKDLPKSDAQHVGGNTNVTGQLRFGQAGFKTENGLINQYTYFREQVFGDKDWREKEDDPDMEVADVWFHVEIEGEDLGYHQLEVRHKPEWEAGQRNVTTMLRWGDLIDEVKERDITGDDFKLYRSEDGGEPFYIVIED
ncbi:MAG: DUF1524 domain-containing protein, partial [Candidatus Nanohaloarchaea archaeon]